MAVMMLMPCLAVLKQLRMAKRSRVMISLITCLTSADATAADLTRLAREQWTIEAQHHRRNVSFGEDDSSSLHGLTKWAGNS